MLAESVGDFLFLGNVRGVDMLAENFMRQWPNACQSLRLASVPNEIRISTVQQRDNTAYSPYKTTSNKVKKCLGLGLLELHCTRCELLGFLLECNKTSVGRLRLTVRVCLH